ncbi:MAG: tetratricopeptide repeat protein [Rubrobacteraceae bacterium]
MAGLNINLFGEFGVWRGEDPIEGEEWGGQKPRSLLKLLLTRPGHVFSKDEIVDALWPGVSSQSADRRLRITVSLLRKALEPDLGRGSDSRYVLSRRPGYSFDERADCEVDAWKYRELQQRAEAAQEADGLDEAIGYYREALDLVRGEFLAEEPYEDWAIGAREQWRESQLAVLSGLAECLALKGRYTEAIETVDRALYLDGYREELHRRAMLYHYCAGEQGLALRAYRNYATVLKEELGAAPSPELVRLKEQIEKRDVPGVDEMRRYPRPRRSLKFPYSLSRTRFVGRDDEYAWLAERLRELAEPGGGAGGAVAVEGEAGVGKTRLAEEFLGYARSRGTLVLSGRCYERELSIPLEPVLDALEALPDMGAALTRLSDSEVGHRSETEPADSARVYRMLTRELIRESRSDDHEGLILFVDDVQWADSATLDFLSYLVRRVLDERILLVFTYRREDTPGLSEWLNRLTGRRALTTLTLDRLTPEDITQMLGRMSSRSFDHLSRLADFLHRESEGNAFYAVEYLRWLIEAGIVEIDARRRISGLESGLLHEEILPSGVRSLLEAWLTEVGEEARGVLELAAVVGRSFDLGLLCKATARGEAETFGLIRPLMASGLVVETPGAAYYFSHDKLRQTLYEGLESPRRRELHLQVAKALESVDAGEPAELAHHYLRARAWRQALENLVLAAQRAEERYAWEAALKSYARALEVAEKLSGIDETRFEVLGAQEKLLEKMDRRQERGETVKEMLRIAKQLGGQARIADVHVRRVGALAALSDSEGAEEAGRAAVTIFREIGDMPGEARGHREVSYIRWMRRDYAGALRATFEALRLHRELGDRSGEAGDVWTVAQVYRSMGDLETSLEWVEESARIYEELGDEFGNSMKIEAMRFIHRERGDLDTALSFGLKALQVNEELGVRDTNVVQHSECGTLYLQLGKPREALVHFRKACRLSREMGFTRHEGHALASTGISLEQLGDAPGATEAYKRAIELLEIVYEESEIEEDLRAKANTLALLGRVFHHSLERLEEALDAYEAAADVYRTTDNVPRLRELLLGLSGLRWRMGDLEGSASGYEEVLGLVRRSEDSAQEAAALASLTVVYRDLGRHEDSLRSGRAALKLLRDLDDPQAEAYVLTSMADSHAELGHYPSALTCLRRSVRLRRKIGDPEGEAGALRDLANIYERLGDADRARSSLEKAARKRETQQGVTAERRT